MRNILPTIFALINSINNTYRRFNEQSAFNYKEFVPMSILAFDILDNRIFHRAVKLVHMMSFTHKSISIHVAYRIEGSHGIVRKLDFVVTLTYESYSYNNNDEWIYFFPVLNRGNFFCFLKQTNILSYRYHGHG